MRTVKGRCAAVLFLAAASHVAAVEPLISQFPFPDGTRFTVSQGYDESRATAPEDRRWVVGLSAPSGTAVVAVNAGMVVEVASTGESPSATTRVVIAHPDGLFSYYVGLPASGLSVVQGRVVTAGERIGVSGPLLHFALVMQSASGSFVSQPVIFRSGNQTPDYIEARTGNSGVVGQDSSPAVPSANNTAAMARPQANPQGEAPIPRPTLPRPVSNDRVPDARSAHSFDTSNARVSPVRRTPIASAAGTPLRAMTESLLWLAMGLGVLGALKLIVSRIQSGHSEPPNRWQSRWSSAHGDTQRGRLDAEWDRRLARRERPAPTPEPPRFRPVEIMTQTEKRFCTMLEEAVPEFSIHPQVAMEALINAIDAKDRVRIKGRRIDFVVKGPDHSILALVELDDRSHDTSLRRADDAQRDKRLKDAGYPVIRWRCEDGRRPTVPEIRARLTTADLVEAVVARETAHSFGGSNGRSMQ